MDYLQDQILQMEAAIAADEGGNHGNPPSSGSHCNTVDRSETKRCLPASSSGSKRRLRCGKRLSCATSESLIDRKSSPIQRTASAESGHHAGSHGDELVTLVDSDSCGDELETSAVKCGNVEERHSRERVGRTGERKCDALSPSCLLPRGDVGRHSNGVSREDEESSQSCGSGANEVDDLDPDKHMDGEMEEGSVGGDSGVNSDEDLFDMSQDKSCIPQTLSQDEGDLRKTRYVPPLLTSTPRPTSRLLPPSHEVQTIGDHSALSMPPGGDNRKYEEEDLLPSLDDNVDVTDQYSAMNSPVETSNNAFDTSINKMGLITTGLVPSNRGVNKGDYDADGRGRCRTSPNRNETAQKDKTLIGGNVNGGSEDRGRNSGVSVVKESELSDCDIVDDGNGWRSVDAKRNVDCSVREIAAGTCKSMDTSRQKQSPCLGVAKIGRKISEKSSPLLMTVASPHGRCRNQTPSPCLANTTDDADFPRRPSWVFIASGISKIDHQVGEE